MATKQIRMLTDAGVIELPVEIGSSEASDIGKHWNAVKQFLHSGDVSLLTPFDGKRIGDHQFAIDPAWIETWGAAGELDYEDIYGDGGA